MSAPAFTPGPWVTVEHPTSIAIRGPDKLNVASITVGYQKLESLMVGHRANARLIAAAPDHALIGWAMCVQDATWEEWSEGAGEFCFAGLRHATKLDEFGCPILTDHLRALLTKARDQ